MNAALSRPAPPRVTVRPVLARDADAEQTFVRGLSLASRQRRFHIGIRELAPDLLRAFTDVDQRDHVALVAEVLADDGVPVIVADARYVRTATPGEAEFALTVADAWQRRGLGLDLLQRLLRHARRHGLTRLYGDVLRDNVAMLGLARSAGARFVAVPRDPMLTRALFEPVPA